MGTLIKSGIKSLFSFFIQMFFFKNILISFAIIEEAFPFPKIFFLKLEFSFFSFAKEFKILDFFGSVFKEHFSSLISGQSGVLRIKILFFLEK